MFAPDPCVMHLICVVIESDEPHSASAPPAAGAKNEAGPLAFNGRPGFMA